MALPHVLVSSYNAIKSCKLVTDHDASPENIAEFKQLLNTAQQATPKYADYRFITKSMFLNNPRNFIHYIMNPNNKVAPLLLWTDNKHIINVLGLHGIVYLTWIKAAQQYDVTLYVKQNKANCEQSKKESAKSAEPQILYYDANLYTSLDVDEAELNNAMLEPTDTTKVDSKSSERVSWADAE